MKSLGNKLLIGFLLVISRLPFSILWTISNLLYFLFYKIIKYRVKVVRKNLGLSFPEKSTEELLVLEKKFYRYLSDLVVETVKGFTISRKVLEKRIDFQCGSIYDDLYENRKSAIVVMGHSGNWEWVCRSAPIFMKNRIVVAYKPLSNPHFEKLMLKARTELGVIQIPMAQIGKFMLQQTEPYLLILAADQSPSDSKSSIWLNFLNQETAVLPGPEKLAIKFNLPVIFHDVNRTKRSVYKCTAKYLVKESKNTGPGEITRLHTSHLEQEIIKQPEIWLWSHKRWKLKK
jgi:KDO2-lipid IV(A) lauroyltransferase